jgi:hypothetical protein
MDAKMDAKIVGKIFIARRPAVGGILSRDILTPK